MNILNRLRRAFSGRRPVPCSISNGDIERIVDEYIGHLAWNLDGYPQEQLENLKTYERECLITYTRWLRMKSNASLERLPEGGN